MNVKKIVYHGNGIVIAFDDNSVVNAVYKLSDGQLDPSGFNKTQLAAFKIFNFKNFGRSILDTRTVNTNTSVNTLEITVARNETTSATTSTTWALHSVLIVPAPSELTLFKISWSAEIGVTVTDACGYARVYGVGGPTISGPLTVPPRASAAGKGEASTIWRQIAGFGLTELSESGKTFNFEFKSAVVGKTVKCRRVSWSCEAVKEI